MDFELPKEIKAVQKETRRFARQEVLTRLKEDGFKRDLVSKMGEIGLFGSAFPDRYGGSNLGRRSSLPSGRRAWQLSAAMTKRRRCVECRRWFYPVPPANVIAANAKAKTDGCTAYGALLSTPRLHLPAAWTHPSGAPDALPPHQAPRAARASLRSPSRVPMMQSADQRQLDHLAELGRLDGSWLG